MGYLSTRNNGAAMSAFLGGTVRGMGQVALATGAGLSLIVISAAALAVTLVVAAPLRLLQTR